MFQYTNRKGVIYYLHARIAGGGKIRYTLKRSAEGALSAMPPGYEVVENVNGQASVRRARPRKITAEEEAVVQSSLERHGLHAYRLEVKGDDITVFEPDRDPAAIAAVFDPLSTLPIGIGKQVEAMVRKQLGDETLEQYVHDRKQQLRAGIEQTMRYAPVLRFRLVDQKRRRFKVTRMSYRGEGGWHALDVTPLAEGAKRYIKHLGKESFFDLV